VKLGYKDGKISFGFNAGAAVGYGVGGSWGVEVDVKKLASAAIGTVIFQVITLPTSPLLNSIARTVLKKSG